ncbi:MAG: hypothetical protein RLZZ419_1094 [Pseudomonadota bacterium]
MLKTFNQQCLAVELLKRQARISIVHKETGLSKRVLREGYHEIHGRFACAGAVKYSTQGLTRTLKKYKEVTFFAACFATVTAKTQDLDIIHVIHAYDLFKKIYGSSQLDFTGAWVVARDLRLGITKLSKCHHCGAPVLLNAREDDSNRCGVCTTELNKLQ